MLINGFLYVTFIIDYQAVTLEPLKFNYEFLNVKYEFLNVRY
jgi:hypothetical protein